jgi:hypothetical protein
MPPTANTLAPNYNSGQNPAERTGNFPMRPEYFADGAELSTEITQHDTLHRLEEPSLETLHELARDHATSAAHVAINQEQAAPARPVREGIDTDDNLARREVTVDGPAVKQIRLAALKEANPERYNNAEFN